MLKTIANYFRYVFGGRRATDIVVEKLKNYQAKCLEHESEAAWNTKMAEYYRESIDRLLAFTPTPIPSHLVKDKPN